MDKQDYTRDAIAVMTEWLNDPDGKRDDLVELVRSIVQERGGGDEAVGLFHLVIGFVNLTGQMLIHEYSVTGRTEETILRELAARVSRE